MPSASFFHGVKLGTKSVIQIDWCSCSTLAYPFKISSNEVKMVRYDIAAIVMGNKSHRLTPFCTQIIPEILPFYKYSKQTVKSKFKIRFIL
ncbi:hypothetical protein Lpp126_17149 [Lacticaseibacillus paracasei subsp. paracasei Lpp126]|uniref:Uncharacterized protein n=1 Tax=Lacticaseibacillus paracasei subsp. paracasei Lpp126 TaxID=1256206 RepID=S2RG00_LACPA|nr:hypothetical protein Lpp126_17149 [Lacticaseibacillus paracasei subsp. paracasei Lpp126]EPC88776.1 hypothetical protein Lpp124_10273 [Lacticaseibacillus paracasei subsp. paracasei CNCM I-4649]